MLTIMHLEDDLILLDIFKTALEARDASINLVQCLRGVQVLDHIQQTDNDVDLYILDIRVRGRMSGVEVAQKLRVSGVVAPIIISSAYEKPAKELLESLACQWVPKPWVLSEFIDHVINLASESANSKDDKYETLDVIDLHQLVSTCMSQARTEAKKKNIHMRIAYRKADDLRTIGNTKALHEAFRNLIENAIRRSTKGDTVLVKLLQADDTVKVIVEDKGIEIQQASLEKIFDPSFYMQDSQNSPENGKHSGGLFSVKQTIESYSGQIRVQSAPEKGSQFIVTLPLASILKPAESTDSE